MKCFISDMALAILYNYGCFVRFLGSEILYNSVRTFVIFSVCILVNRSIEFSNPLSIVFFLGVQIIQSENNCIQCKLTPLPYPSKFHLLTLQTKSQFNHPLQTQHKPMLSFSIQKKNSFNPFLKNRDQKEILSPIHQSTPRLKL